MTVRECESGVSGKERTGDKDLVWFGLDWTEENSVPSVAKKLPNFIVQTKGGENIYRFHYFRPISKHQMNILISQKFCLMLFCGIINVLY